MSKGFDYAPVSSENIEAIAFRTIASYVHDTYDNVGISNVTPDEAFFIATVRATEEMISALGENADLT